MDEQIQNANDTQSEPEYLNPWLSVWLHPRKTIRYIAFSNSNSSTLFFAAFLGIVHVLTQTSRLATAGVTVPLPFAVIGGGILGVICIYILGAIVTMVGGWFGGSASSDDVRAALVWAQVPNIIPFLFVVLLPLILRSQQAMIVLMILSILTGLVFGIWAFVLTLAMVSEVFQFSAGRGFVTLFVGNIIFTIPIMILAFAAGVAVPLLMHSQNSGKSFKINSASAGSSHQTVRMQLPTSNIDFQTFIAESSPVVVTLSDGNVFEGKILEEMEADVIFESNAGIQNFSKYEIRDVKKKV